jgi:methionyl-tRNA formyltransferase
MTRAVVFAYHDVGARCLAVLLAHGIRIPLVVTHTDDPGEKLWFESVAALARAYGLPVATPADPNHPDFVARVAALKPDFLFSFYYRLLLAPGLLSAAHRGAFNMHGSLLPKYRGRVPVNWAILCGERETGATLHEMAVKADAGPIVDQQAVPILPNDTALDVFRKVTTAAELVLDRSLPKLVAGTAKRRPQDLSAGRYFGGRRPEDGRIDWTKDATSIHNLVRAVAPPYPGAFCRIGGKTLRLLRTLDTGERSDVSGKPALLARGDELHIRCADGGMLKVLSAELDGGPLNSRTISERLGTDSQALTNDPVGT